MVILALWIVGTFLASLAYTGVAGIVGHAFYNLDDLAKLDVSGRKFYSCFVGVLWPLTAAPVMLMPLLSEKMARMRKEYEEMERQVRKEMHQ